MMAQAFGEKIRESGMSWRVAIISSNGIYTKSNTSLGSFYKVKGIKGIYFYKNFQVSGSSCKACTPSLGAKLSDF